MSRHAAIPSEIGPASLQDADAIAALFAERGRDQDVVVRASPDWVRHHLFGFEDARVFVSRRQGAIDGCLSCYALDTISGTQVRRVAVIEYLLASGPAAAAALVAETLAFAAEQGAKGVVLENTTYLDDELCAEVGLMPSTRRMVAAVACRSLPVNTPGGLLLDVK